MSPAALVEPVLEGLCEEMTTLLRAELAAGNVVAETSHAWPAKLNVFLAKPFRATVPALPPQVVRREVNDPHYWLAEYQCTTHDHLLACKFGR